MSASTTTTPSSNKTPKSSRKNVPSTPGSAKSDHHKSYALATTGGASPVVGSPATASIGNALSYKPTLIHVPPMRFLIMDAPRQSNMHLYIKEMGMCNVHDLVRVCEPTYHSDALQSAGIACHDMEYPDGHSPPTEIIDKWLELVDATFFANNSNSNNNKKNKTNNSLNAENKKKNTPIKNVEAEATVEDEPALAVHCVAGLGRAPVMVAIALVEFANMDAVEAVTLIRRQRKGSINEKQLLYLEGYKRRYKRKGDPNGACVIM